MINFWETSDYDDLVKRFGVKKAESYMDFLMWMAFRVKCEQLGLEWSDQTITDGNIRVSPAEFFAEQIRNSTF